MDLAKENLLTAIKEGNYEEVKKLLKTFELRAVLSITRDRDTYALLNEAVSSKYPLITKLLLEKFQKVKFPIAVGRPLIFMAVENRDIETVKILLDQGADVNLKQYVDGTRKAKSYTALHTAAEKGNLEIVKLLVNKGADIDAKNTKDDSPLMLAAAQSDFFDVFQYLIEKGADINTQGFQGETALHRAVNAKCFEHVKLLIEKGANIETQDLDGQTPLHRSVFTNNVEIVKYLLEKGANVNLQDSRNRTPLYNATTNDYLDKLSKTDIVKLLLEHGAKFHSKGTNLQDLADVAFNASSEHLVKVFFDYNPTLRFENGKNSVFSTNEPGTWKTVTSLKTAVVLIEHGADSNEEFRFKRKVLTALNHALSQKSFDLVERLLNAGADVNKVSNYLLYGSQSVELSPLYVAMYKRHERIFSLLLNRGADVNVFPQCFPFAPYRIYFRKNGINWMFIRHIVILKHQNLEVDERLLEFVNGNSYLSQYYAKCDQEMGVIKNRKFNHISLTYLQILTTRRVNLLEAFVKNSDVEWALMEVRTRYEEWFPIYGPDVTKKLKMGLERKKVMEQAAKCQRILFRPVYCCIDQIFNYLSNEDIRVLIKVCEPLKG